MRAFITDNPRVAFVPQMFAPEVEDTSWATARQAIADTRHVDLEEVILLVGWLGYSCVHAGCNGQAKAMNEAALVELFCHNV